MPAHPTVEKMIADLETQRQTSLELLDGLDPEAMVYPTGGWRVKDILTHLNAWEAEAVLALQAHARGEARQPVADESEESHDRYNDVIFQQQRDLPMATILEQWQATRSNFIQAIRDLPAEQWDVAFLFPWSQHDVPRRMVGGMLWHEDYHREDALVATGRKERTVEA